MLKDLQKLSISSDCISVWAFLNQFGIQLSSTLIDDCNRYVIWLLDCVGLCFDVFLWELISVVISPCSVLIVVWAVDVHWRRFESDRSNVLEIFEENNVGVCVR